MGDKIVDSIEQAYAAKPDDCSQVAIIKAAAKALAYTFSQGCPPCRETSLAMTNLEQATLWALTAIAKAKIKPT